MRYKLTVEAAADLSRIVLPRDAKRPANHAADDFWMAVFGHPPAKMPEVGTDRGFTGTVATSWPGGFTYGVREVDVRCVLWARWDLENGARADLERVNDALGAADHFVLAITLGPAGEVPPLLARALECVGAELLADARPAPAGLLAAIQPSGRLHIPLGGSAALRWIVRLIGGASQDASAIGAAMEEGRLDDALRLAGEAAGEGYYVSVSSDDAGRLTVRWDGQWTSSRWASVTVWRDPTPGCADLDTTIEWDEGERDDAPQRGAGWSRHLDIVRAFGQLLASATPV